MAPGKEGPGLIRLLDFHGQSPFQPLFLAPLPGEEEELPLAPAKKAKVARIHVSQISMLSKWDLDQQNV